MMNPFDDTLPEEREPQYEELTTLLQQAYSKPASVTPDRQAQILARVRERLGITDADEGVVSQDSIDIAQFGAPPPTRGVPRQHRFSRLLTLIAAALVIVAFIVTDLLIFQARTPLTATYPTIDPTVGPPGKPITVHTQAGGVDKTLQVTAGPYFLGEMLEVDLTVTNHTHDTIPITNEFLKRTCAPYFPAELPKYPDEGELIVMMTGGGRPSDTNLQHNLSTFGCGVFTMPPIWYLPNMTFTLSKYVVLTNSGRITLTAQIGFEEKNKHWQGLPNSDPRAGHWPSLQINVQAGIPADRWITGQQKGTQVTIEAPPLVRSKLLYAFTLLCDNGFFQSEGSNLTKMTLQQPQCDYYVHGNPPNRFVKWTYAVGAPGYAVFSGSTQR
jgi:hypothetical protein